MRPLLRLHPGDERVHGTCRAYFCMDAFCTGDHGRLAGVYIELESIAADVRAAVEDSDL
jgi:hypothetical protein